MCLKQPAMRFIAGFKTHSVKETPRCWTCLVSFTPLGWKHSSWFEFLSLWEKTKTKVHFKSFVTSAAETGHTQVSIRTSCLTEPALCAADSSRFISSPAVCLQRPLWPHVGAIFSLISLPLFRLLDQWETMCRDQTWTCSPNIQTTSVFFTHLLSVQGGEAFPSMHLSINR